MPAYSTRQWPSLDSGSSGPSVFEPFGYMISVVLRYFFPSYPPKQKQNFNSHLIASFFETGAIATLSKSRNSTIVGQEVPNIQGPFIYYVTTKEEDGDRSNAYFYLQGGAEDLKYLRTSIFKHFGSYFANLWNLINIQTRY